MTMPPETNAETRLAQDLRSLSRTDFGDGAVPTQADDDCRIRAIFLRDLILTADINAKGLRIRGAWIDGRLDLQGAEFHHDLSFSQCHFSDAIVLDHSKVSSLRVSGCTLHNFSAENTYFAGTLYIRDGSDIQGELNLSGSEVCGDVQLCDLTIESNGQDAIFAPALSVHGSLFLGNYPYNAPTTSLTCHGGLFFSSAKITDDVFITNCSIATNDDITLGSPFGTTEEHGAGIAMSLARARIGGLLYFQANQIVGGAVNLAGAETRRLNDEPKGPGASYPIRLDGFRYTDFSRHTDTGVKTRLAWLARRPDGTPFTAQPYEHLARVLSEMGHTTDAQTVLMRKERLMWAENKSAAQGLRKPILWAVDLILRFSVGYGYRPIRASLWAAVLIAVLGLFYQKTWNVGDFAPNAAPILVSSGWANAKIAAPENPATHWTGTDPAGTDWETFHPWAYAADLLIPIVNLGQESAWAPTTSRSNWGVTGWWLRWFAKGVGWILTALGAAAITGLIRRD